MNFDKYVSRTYKKYESALEYYKKHIFKEIGDIENVFSFKTINHLHTPPKKENMAQIHKGETWGGEYMTMWLLANVTVPQCADGEILCAIPHTDAYEILCFIDDKPHGIISTKKTSMGIHPVMFISQNAKANEEYNISFECYAGHNNFGDNPYASDNETAESFEHKYEGIKLAILDKEMRDFVFDLYAVLSIAKLPSDNFKSSFAISCLMDAFSYFIQDVDEYSEKEIHDSIKKVRSIVAPVLEKCNYISPSRGYAGTIGHAHIDTMWLWPLSETIRKCARTYSEVLTLMDMYPDYHFIQSAPYHIELMRKYYPSVFEGIKKKVHEGRYELNGGTWIENDCNIPSGESLVRQFLYGQNCLEKHFGFKSDSYWMLDTFGYSGSIPQIMLGVGIKYFYSSKMFQGDLNLPNTDTFLWHGIDGSEVIAHFNRNSPFPDINTICGAVNGISDKLSNDSRLIAYGYGDGGGGPSYETLETLSRARNIDGLPKIEETTISRFMKDRIEPEYKKLPIIDGELYFESHRGTYTQMCKVKKQNRISEQALHDMEYLSVISNKNEPSLREELWKTLLVHQFHDYLPGTCIKKVYEEEIPIMEKLISDTQDITKKYAKSLCEQDNTSYTIINTLPFDRDDEIVFDGNVSFQDTPCQTYYDIEGKEKTAISCLVPAFSSRTLKLGNSPSISCPFTKENGILNTPFYLVRFDEYGYISSLYDKKSKREIKSSNGDSLGSLYFGECMPTRYDNWEIEYDVFNKLSKVKNVQNTTIISCGCIEYRLRSEYKISEKSSAIVDTIFYANDPKIAFEMKLNWNEKHSILKANFDVSIKSNFVRNEIQFGNIQRPTTRNNSYEEAKFEICNHKWTDISEPRYGVSILNDCKYGISANGSTLMLTLAKGCHRPDNETDNGIHTMKYALLPHACDFSANNVVHPAYIFNYPHIVIEGKANIKPLAKVDASNIIIDSVKPSEKHINAFVLRIYECEGSQTNCTLSLDEKYNSALVYETNLLEEEEKVISKSINGNFDLTFHPFEIKTILAKTND